MPRGGPELRRGKGIGVQAGNSQLNEGDKHVQVTDIFMLTKDTSTYFAGETLHAIS